MFDWLRKLFAEDKKEIEKAEEEITCTSQATCHHIQGCTEETAKKVCKACEDWRHHRLPKPRRSSGSPQFTEEEQIRLLLES